MKISFRKILILLLTICLFATSSGLSSFSVSAKTNEEKKQELQAQADALAKEIKDLKKEAKDKKAILNALQKKVDNTQAQIRNANSHISSINKKISANKSEIAKKNSEIEDKKQDFKKRIRAIYMSNTGSNVQVLLGADDFAQFLQLSQLTSSISARDKKLMENLVAEIKQLQAVNAENNKLLEQQISVKKSIEQTQAQLTKEENEAEKLYNEINKDIKSAEAEKADLEDDIANLNKTFSGSGGSFINSVIGFTWPVPSCSSISSYYGYRVHPVSGKKKMHYGIDIAGGGIYGKPIVAITDGVIEKTYTSCPHRSKKPSCSCGGGYGNYVAIDHGKISGSSYYAMYAHMDHLASGMVAGKKVTKGQVIGYVGTTGTSTGYHLHFGIKKNGSWVNPMNYYTKVK